MGPRSVPQTFNPDNEVVQRTILGKIIRIVCQRDDRRVVVGGDLRQRDAFAIPAKDFVLYFLELFNPHRCGKRPVGVMSNIEIAHFTARIAGR